jgi:hypothetical protein
VPAFSWRSLWKNEELEHRDRGREEEGAVADEVDDDVRDEPAALQRRRQLHDLGVPLGDGEEERAEGTHRGERAEDARPVEPLHDQVDGAHGEGEEDERLEEGLERRPVGLDPAADDEGEVRRQRGAHHGGGELADELAGGAPGVGVEAERRRVERRGGREEGVLGEDVGEHGGPLLTPSAA